MLFIQSKNKSRKIVFCVLLVSLLFGGIFSWGSNIALAKVTYGSCRWEFNQCRCVEVAAFISDTPNCFDANYECDQYFDWECNYDGGGGATCDPTPKCGVFSISKGAQDTGDCVRSTLDGGDVTRCYHWINMCQGGYCCANGNCGAATCDKVYISKEFNDNCNSDRSCNIDVCCCTSGDICQTQPKYCSVCSVGFPCNSPSCGDRACSDYPACSVTATANPNPIPSGQNRTTIGTRDEIGIDSCIGTGTFVQNQRSVTYTVNCIGDSTHDDCSDTVTVTKERMSTTTITVSTTTTTTIITTTTTPPTTIFPSSCNIILESDYLARFLGYSFLLNWSTINCINCEASCINIDSEQDASDSCGNWTGSIPNMGSREIIPSQSGKYRYIINCDGDLGMIAGITSIDVKVAPLPWWREIIPKLSGFLRGVLVK